MDAFERDFDQDEFAQDYLNNDTNILTLDNDMPNSEFTETATLVDDPYEQYDQNDEETENPVELSPGGVLDEDSVGQGLSNLGRCADGTQHIFLKLSLPGLSLNDITILADFVHLQTVELPYNEISDLSVFSHMPHLLELDVSHNQISQLLDFKPPKNLKSVNMSYNMIKTMTDLSEHHYLQKLVIDNNQISIISGISNCKRLNHLSVAHNNLSEISGLEKLPIKYLDLSGNNISTIENIDSLRILQSLNLSGNKIRSLRGLEGHDFLESIDMEDNEIIDLPEVQYVAQLPLVRQLNLQRNPIRELPDYRLSVIFQIQKLSELDRRKVDVEEKYHALYTKTKEIYDKQGLTELHVASGNMFNPQMEVIAARDHIMHVVYSFLQPSRVLDSCLQQFQPLRPIKRENLQKVYRDRTTLPSVETPYPMLVLVGPQGAGKKDLAMKLVDEFPDYFGYGISHTTRKPHADEEEGKDYHFMDMEEFENEVKMGKFLQTYSYHGHLYGLTIDSVEAVAREGLACVVHMELEGVLTVKNTYFEPRYVLTMPLSREAHERRLRERGVYSESQIEWTLNRADVYAEYNRDHPGFFDMFINSDDITDSYRRLRRLVMDYLGMNVPSPDVSDALDQSHTGSQFFEKEATNDTMGSAAGGGAGNNGGMGARTWSKPSLADNGSQGVNNVLGMAMSPMPPAGRGVVEEASLRRRASAAKEAVSGTRPSLYEQILQKAPRTVPQAVSAQVGLGDEEMVGRSLSAPLHGLENMDALPPSSPDSSDIGSEHSSGLTNISEARDVDVGGSPDGSEQQPGGGGAGVGEQLPDRIVDPLELMSGSNSKSFSGGPMAPRPNSRTSQSASGGQNGALSPPGTPSSQSGRPGSSRHPVLPPIGQADKVALPEF